MDGTEEYYAKCNKPGSKRQIPYDLTYKWNLINKTNKRAKENRRYGSKEKMGSDQKGGERELVKGKKGKGQVKEHEERTHENVPWIGD